MKSAKIFAVLSFAVVLLLSGGTFDQSQALLADHECSFCHDFHGNPGYSTLLIAENSELVCLSCHTVSINDTAAAEVHNPLALASNQPGYITCRECHDAHSSSGSNIKLVGYKRDAQNWSSSFTIPGIRKELPSTVGLTYNVVTYTGPTDFNIAGDSTGACETCHDPYHNEGNDCTQCHSHSGGFPKPDCTAIGCHDGNGTGALAVGVGSSHSTDTIFASQGVTFTCGDCHTSHGTAGNVLIPNNPTVGINYNSAGHGGISLGSTVATGTTEADICWNCHLSYGVSEWGSNTGGSYDYGSLHDSSSDTTPSPGNYVKWTTGYWKSANFSYKNGPLNTRPVDASADPGDNAAGRGSASIHATGGTVGTQSNTLSEVRCSYCHDVHDTLGVSGKPYLRGNWTANAYPEDGAPQSGDTWATSSPFDDVDLPRGLNSQNGLGGYQIDQNNSSVDHSGYSYATDDALCSACHLTNGISTGFVGTYPLHRNVVKGFNNDAATPARNIFQRSQRSTANDRYDPWMAYFGITDYYDSKGWMGGLREVAAGNPSKDIGVLPSVAGQAKAYDDFSWGVSVDDATIDVDFHSFTCSKCHNPHASRLPRLMISNCLDVQRNTWDDDYTGDSNWSNWPKLTPASTASEGYKEIAYANSAQNCHRYFPAQDKPTGGTGDYSGDGWNNVTPW